MAENIKGNAQILYIWDGTDTYEPVVCLTSLNKNESVNVVESITKCSTSRKAEAGTSSYEIGFEGEYVETEADKVSFVELRTKLRTLGNFTWRITTTYSNASTDNEYGTAFFSDLESTSTTKDENITFSGTLMGSGDITDTDPNA